jgi:hypothetical protein
VVLVVLAAELPLPLVARATNAIPTTTASASPTIANVRRCRRARPSASSCAAVRASRLR